MPFDETSDTKSNGLSHRQATVEPMEHSLEQKDQLAELRHFMETLPQPHRRFMVLRYCNGLKLKEIAEKEGCKIGTVKSVIHRATHTLRLKLRRLYKQLNAN